MASTAWCSRMAQQGPHRHQPDRRQGRRRQGIREGALELAKTQPSFRRSYKFMNLVTKSVEPKQMYCERPYETAVCGGIYQ